MRKKILQICTWRSVRTLVLSSCLSSCLSYKLFVTFLPEKQQLRLE